MKTTSKYFEEIENGVLRLTNSQDITTAEALYETCAELMNHSDTKDLQAVMRIPTSDTSYTNLFIYNGDEEGTFRFAWQDVNEKPLPLKDDYTDYFSEDVHDWDELVDTVLSQAEEAGYPIDNFAAIWIED